MRRVVTGVDGDGRSTVISDGPPAAFKGSIDGVVRVEGDDAVVRPGEAIVHALWATGPHVARNATDPTSGRTEQSFQTPAGHSDFIITEFGPDVFAPMHDTATVDYAVVVRGTLELGLETGPVTLHAGDTLFVDGVMHSWRSGPDGATIATVQIGLADDQR